MKHSTKYVALDVHQASTVASVRGETGRVIALMVLPTDERTLVEFFRRMRRSVHVTFEEGAPAQWLHDVLVRVVDRVIVCDRRGRAARQRAALTLHVWKTGASYDPAQRSSGTAPGRAPDEVRSARAIGALSLGGAGS